MSKVRYRRWCRREVREKQIIQYLLGREAKSTDEIARGIGVSHYTAFHLVRRMRDDGMIIVQDIRARPIKYYVPMENQ